MTPFDYVRAINEKTGLVVNKEDKEYNKYIVNLAFSYYIDTILIVNELNMYPNIDNKQHYDFLYNIISKRKRWSKWNKKEDDEFVDGVSDLYNVSSEKAKEVIKTLNEEQLSYIKKLLEAKSGSNK